MFEQMFVTAQQAPSQGGGMLPLFMLVALVFVIASLWKVFTKAGQPGWAAIVPIYNMVVLCKVANRPVWWVVLMCVPVVNIFVLALLSMDVAKAFGKGAGFGVGLWLFGFVFYPMLAFGKAQYQGGQTQPAFE